MAHLDRPKPHDNPLPALPPLNGDRPSEPSTSPDSTASVSLRRLLGLATLTPPQAAHIAGEVLDLLDADSDGRAAVGADTDTVAIAEDGSVRLLSGHARRDIVVTAELVDELARNADRPVARRNPTSAGLLTALARCSGALRDEDLPAARAALLSAARTDGLDKQQSKRELAALVAIPLRPTTAAQAAAQPVPSGAQSPVHPAETTAPIRLPAQPRSGATAARPVQRATGPRRRLITSIVIVSLALIGIVATIALVRPGGGPGPSTGPSTGPTTSAPTGSHAAHHRTAAGRHHHRSIPVLAPPSARAISRVTLTPAARCRRGTACAVTVRVWLRPPWLSSLHWHATAVNRCTGRMHRIASGAMVAQAGWRSAYTTVQLPVPDKRRLALIAVVDKPVSAASRPLLVTSSRGCG